VIGTALVETAGIAAAAYLLGSVSFAVLVSRLMGLPDPRSYGSKNPGATNVLRSGSRVAAALTLVGDTGKGALAVLLASLYTGEPAALGMGAPVAGAMAFLGHVYPVYHGFKGGKGVATAAGVLLALDPLKLGLPTLVSFGVLVGFFRMVSFASVIAAAFAIFAVWLVYLAAPISFAVTAMALLLIWRHQANIGRIMSGTEPQLGGKKAGEKKT
jgi:glycerol-3-phosphate acyltransferase PlsY